MPKQTLKSKEKDVTWSLEISPHKEYDNNKSKKTSFYLEIVI